MTDERIIEEMARLDGKPDEYILAVGKDLAFFGYLTDHNAVQRVIDGLGEKELRRFVLELNDGDCYDGLPDVCEVVKQSPRQKCESILRATGVWEDG